MKAITVFCSFKIGLYENTNNNEYLTIRDYSRVNWNKYKITLNEHLKKIKYTAMKVNECYNTITPLIQCTEDSIIPQKKIKPNRINVPEYQIELLKFKRKERKKICQNSQHCKKKNLIF